MKIYRAIWLLLLPLTITFSVTAQAETPELLHHAGGDITSTFADWPVFILIGGATGALLLKTYDENIETYFANHHVSSKMDTIGKWTGNPFILIPLTAGVYGTSFLTKNDEFKMTSETLVESLIFTEVMTEGLKLSFNRTRPNGSSKGFPSAHTSTVFDIASVLQAREGAAWGIPAYLFAGFVGFSRVDGTAHYFTDVLFGAALGSAIGWGTALFHNNENTKLLISPIFDQTRGIMVTYKF